MEPLVGTGTATPATDDGIIKDATMESFMADVIEASATRPILVDFWADWCGPCKQLGPLLERLVREAAGAVALVKVDADANQMLTQQLRVQSLPTVMVFQNGQPVDGFQGALPESELKAFIDKHAAAGGGADQEAQVAAYLEQANATLVASEIEQALSMFEQLVEAAPENAEARAGLARSHLANSDVDGALAVLDAASGDMANDPAITSVRAAAKLTNLSADAGNPDDLKARVAANEEDHQARFDLALAYVAQGDLESAADALMEIMRRDLEWNESAARKQLLTLFDVAGAMDPFTVKYRRKLSSLLFS